MTDTNNTDGAALLPCPVCSNRAFLSITGVPGHRSVWCLTEQCLRMAPRETEAEAIAAWNTRAPLPATQRQEYDGEAVREALADIAAERQRQIDKEGWTCDHDDEHSDGQLASAAAAYSYAASLPERLRANISGIYSINNNGLARDLWPWDKSWWKLTTPRRDLVKAGALIVAEIERIDRAALAHPAQAAPSAASGDAGEGE